MKVLETERLILRRLTLDDAAFLLELMNEPGFIRFVADRGLRTNEDAAKFILEKILPSYERHNFGFYRVELKESGTPIGICGFIKRDALESVDIGFATLQRFGGKGYTFEAAAATFRYGLSELQLGKIVGITAPDNTVSQHILGKLGLRYSRTVHVPGYSSDSSVFE